MKKPVQRRRTGFEVGLLLFFNAEPAYTPALARFVTRPQAELQIGARPASKPNEGANLRAKPLIVNRFKVFKGSANRGFRTRLVVSMPSDAEYNLSVA